MGTPGGMAQRTPDPALRNILYAICLFALVDWVLFGWNISLSIGSSIFSFVSATFALVGTWVGIRLPMYAAVFATQMHFFAGVAAMVWNGGVSLDRFFDGSSSRKALWPRDSMNRVIMSANHVICLSCLLLFVLSKAGIELRWGAINVAAVELGASCSVLLSGICVSLPIMPGYSLYSLDDPKGPPKLICVFIAIAVPAIILVPFPSWMLLDEYIQTTVYQVNLWHKSTPLLF